MGGEVRLPGPGGMEQTIDKERSWKRSWMPNSSARAAIWQLHMMKYHDMLCQDMGVAHKRKGLNVAAEVFAPYTADDYAELFDHPPHARCCRESASGGPRVPPCS